MARFKVDEKVEVTIGLGRATSVRAENPQIGRAELAGQSANFLSKMLTVDCSHSPDTVTWKFSKLSIFQIKAFSPKIVKGWGIV